MKNKYLVYDGMKFSSFFLLVFLVSFISCTSYTYVDVEVLSPAKKEFPQQLQKLVVVDRKSFDFTSDSSSTKVFF